MKIFPVKNKRPLIPGWQKAATDDYEGVIDTWAEAYPGCDWGVPTGAANGVTVLDIDAPEGWETLKTMGITVEPTYMTPSGGAHVYLAYEPGLRNSAGKLGPGLDIRGDGGYVVAYDYEAAENALGAPLPPLHPTLQAILQKSFKEATRLPNEGGTGVVVVEGGRNQYLTSLAGRLQKQGLLTWEGLEALNERDCNPPLPMGELKALYESVSRYSPDPEAVPEAPPSPIWASSLVANMLAYLNDKDLVKGMPTGLEALDKLLGGGKRLGELTVTLAEAKTGKNTLWHQLLVGWLNKGVKIGYASRELSPEEEVLPNLLSVQFLSNMLKANRLDEAAIKARVEQWGLAFADGYGAMEGDSLFQWMDVCREAGIQYFFIDHLHYLLEDPEDFKFISKLIRKIKSYAKANKVHIDLIVQPKILEPGARLGLNSLRGGASIGQALDNLFTLQRVRDDSGRRTNVVHICLEAARHKLASLGDFYLQYDPETMTFIEVVPAPDSSREGQTQSAVTGSHAPAWSGKVIQ